MTAPDEPLEDLLRRLAPRVLGVVARRTASFASAEDAVQEALLAAAVQWPRGGLPDAPTGWLVRVAERRLTDEARSESARRAREQRVASAPAPVPVSDQDDGLLLLLLCAHPALTDASAIALTLRAVGGLTTAEVARAFLTPEATMGQRISRAKSTITAAGGTFTTPGPDELPDRVQRVEHVLYLIFNEGYTATSGDDLQRRDVATEAVRLTRLLRASRPDDAEVCGLLALMLLLASRSAARTDPDGRLVALPDQDRSRWDRAAIDEGLTLLAEATSGEAPGRYSVEAAIAAEHSRTNRAQDTDWFRIEALYGALERVAPGPATTMNRAVATAMAHGPSAGLAVLDSLPGHRRGAPGHRELVVRAHLVERSGDVAAAATLYARAAALATNIAERDHLTDRSARALRLASGTDPTV